MRRSRPIPRMFNQIADRSILQFASNSLRGPGGKISDAARGNEVLVEAIIATHSHATLNGPMTLRTTIRSSASVWRMWHD